MIDETLIASLGAADADADALLAEAFGSKGADATMEGLIGGQTRGHGLGLRSSRGASSGSPATTSSSTSGSRASLIAKEEFGDELSTLKVGDEIDVLLETLEGEGGLVQLCQRKADRQIAQVPHRWTRPRKRTPSRAR
ncbi:MAG: hypothetical protein R3B49_04450 [Phycisphaerales bacterium]